ncbi:MAG: hypothetical protein KGL74_04110 [Elusimicrobia bacterium]|nr:hypothetical protein [Elusimicrobiota bacterium]
MEFILRLLNLRTFLIAGAVVAAVVLADRYQEYPRMWYENRMNARERGSNGLGNDIARDLDAVESARFKALYRTVSDEIAAAQAKGFDVARLQVIADKSLALDTPRYRAAAMERLNLLRMAIPQAKETFRPAAENEDPADAPPDSPKPSRAKRTRTR